MIGVENVRIEDINGDGHTEVLRIRKDGLICQDLRGKKLWEVTGMANPVIQEIRDFADRKSTRLNSSHSQISYAVFCLKKKQPLQTRTALNESWPVASAPAPSLHNR